MSLITKKNSKADNSRDLVKFETINVIQEVLYNIRLNKVSEDDMRTIALNLMKYTSTKTL